MKNFSILIVILLLSSLVSCAYSQNQTTVPFYIFLGQSNLGWASANDMNAQQAALFGGVVPMTEIWNPGVGAYSAVWQPMSVGENTRCENYADVSQFGPEASFISSLQRQQSLTRLVYKQGQGGTTLAVDWRPPVPGFPLYTAGSRWQQLTEWLTLAVSQAAAQGFKLDLRAIVWMQGEDDAYLLTDAVAYLTNLGNFFYNFENMWQEFINTYGFPNTTYKKVIGRIYAPVGYPFRDVVRFAQENFCADAANNAILINTDNYPLQDWVHYNATGQIQFGLDIFSVLGDNVPLPVTFIDFKAQRKSADILLSWSVGNEYNISRYEVEKSADGITFSKNAEVPSRSNNGSASYTATDMHALQGPNFYRIKAVGKNNDIKYTSIAKINMRGEGAVINLFPNPAAGTEVFMQIKDLNKGVYLLKLYNYSGQQVYVTSFLHSGGELKKSVNLSGLARGVYKIVLSGKGNVSTAGIVH